MSLDAPGLTAMNNHWLDTWLRRPPEAPHHESHHILEQIHHPHAAEAGGQDNSDLPEHGHLGEGYSLTEVMTASVLLALLVINGVHLQQFSSRSFQQSRQRDSTSALISSDLESIRARSFHFYRCDASTTGCTSDQAFADGQIAYNPPANLCLAGTLAETLVNSDAALAGTHNLTIPSAQTSALQGFTISRTMTASGNELSVLYQVSSPSGVLLSQQATFRSGEWPFKTQKPAPFKSIQPLAACSWSVMHPWGTAISKIQPDPFCSTCKSKWDVAKPYNSAPA